MAFPIFLCVMGTTKVFPRPNPLTPRTRVSEWWKPSKHSRVESRRERKSFSRSLRHHPACFPPAISSVIRIRYALALRRSTRIRSFRRNLKTLFNGIVHTTLSALTNCFDLFSTHNVIEFHIHFPDGSFRSLTKHKKPSPPPTSHRQQEQIDPGAEGGRKRRNFLRSFSDE